MNGTTLYGTSIYESKGAHREEEEDDEHNEEVVEESSVASSIRREEIWREIVKTSDGRDKAFVSTSLLYAIQETERLPYRN